jgi:hypothetical protein
VKGMSEIKTGLECPICKNINPISSKNCLKCCKWLLDTKFDSKEVDVYSKSLKGYKFRTFIIILITLTILSLFIQTINLAVPLFLFGLIMVGISIVLNFVRLIFKKGPEYKTINSILILSIIIITVEMILLNYIANSIH